MLRSGLSSEFRPPASHACAEESVPDERAARCVLRCAGYLTLRGVGAVNIAELVDPEIDAILKTMPRMTGFTFEGQKVQLFIYVLKEELDKELAMIVTSNDCRRKRR